MKTFEDANSQASEREAISYEFKTTADGSPTLAFQGHEAMHSQNGAFSETVFIYERAIDYVLREKLPEKFVIVGMGLGYIEMMIAAKMAAATENFSMRSFENSLFLKENFFAWLDNNSSVTSPGFWNSYQKILRMTAGKFKIPEDEIKTKLSEWKQKEIWRIENSLNVEVCDHEAASSSALLYDLYSSKMDETLWSEPFLEKFLDSFSGTQCVFTTYASTGALKRALRGSGFSPLDTTGFGPKRESTFAVKRTRLE